VIGVLNRFHQQMIRFWTLGYVAGTDESDAVWDALVDLTALGVRLVTDREVVR
jgi:hypothetical protein